MQTGVHLERRHFPRIPLNVPLTLKTGSQKSVMNVLSTDLNPSGIQIVSDDLVNPHELVELRHVKPASNTDYDVKGQIRWVKSEKGKFRSGIAFQKSINWPITLSDLIQGFEVNVSQSSYFQCFLDTVDDGILIFDPNLNIVAANSNQPFCLPREPRKLRGTNAVDFSSLVSNSTDHGSLKKVLQWTLTSGEEVRIGDYRHDPLEKKGSDGSRYYNIWFSPLISSKKSSNVVLRSRDITAVHRFQEKESAREETYWLQYKHVILGQLFDDLLEDIINPLSAVVGRLDLTALKMSSVEISSDNEQIKEWISDLESIQTTMGQITEFCRAASRRREKEVTGAPGGFCLNRLIRNELTTLNLHSFFRNIKKDMSLSQDLGPLYGDYADWANMFIALCQVMMRQMSTLDRREMSIQTSQENGVLFLRISHNGKALNLPIDEDYSLAVLRLLRKKYGVTLSVAGGSGFQTVTLKMPISNVQEPRK